MHIQTPLLAAFLSFSGNHDGLLAIIIDYCITGPLSCYVDAANTLPLLCQSSISPLTLVLNNRHIVLGPQLTPTHCQTYKKHIPYHLVKLINVLWAILKYTVTIAWPASPFFLLGPRTLS